MKYLNVPLAQTAISAAVVQFVERDAGIKERENLHCGSHFFYREWSCLGWLLPFYQSCRIFSCSRSRMMGSGPIRPTKSLQVPCPHVMAE